MFEMEIKAAWFSNLRTIILNQTRKERFPVKSAEGMLHSGKSPYPNVFDCAAAIKFKMRSSFS